MSTYCISDIHGEIDKYLAMLELINFSDDDEIYVLGDVIDRKPSGVDILLDIMERENVFMILGNHEKLALDALDVRYVYGARQLWQQNGGSCTRQDLLYKRTPEVRHKVLRFLRTLPDHAEIEVNDRKFYLVHGNASDYEDDRLWDRPKVGDPAPIPGVTVICGHTPTIYLNGDDGNPLRIWHGNDIICIDCGCGNRTDLRRLACLRLDDMEEFYV